MSGSYPDVPGPRLAYDVDGTQMFSIAPGGANTTLSAGVLAELNDEDDAVSGAHTNSDNQQWQIGFLFPVPMDIVGMFLTGQFTLDSYLKWHSIEVSTDSTTGADGTWTKVIDSPQGDSNTAGRNLPTVPFYRTEIKAVPNALGITGLRYNGWRADSGTIRTWHLYGQPSDPASVTGLALWHPTLDQPLPAAALDFGNARRGSERDKSFRVKNVGGQTASGITLSIEVTNDVVPPVAAQLSLSHNGGAFGPTAAVGNLAPGAIAPVSKIRRVTPEDAVLGLWTGRVRAVAASWA